MMQRRRSMLSSDCVMKVPRAMRLLVGTAIVSLPHRHTLRSNPTGSFVSLRNSAFLSRRTNVRRH